MKTLERLVISNKSGMQVNLLNFGARIERIRYPKEEKKIDLCLYYSDINQYLSDSYFLGTIVGRYCNRIENASFKLEGISHELEQNNFENNLHSGEKGFHNQFWNIEVAEEQRVVFRYFSEDGEGGFPGNVKVLAEYLLTDDNKLILDIQAETDKPCPVSITGHAYFNLSGQQSLIREHELSLNSDAFLPVNKYSIPLEKTKLVDNSTFDFRKKKNLGKVIDSDDEQIVQSKGIDHCFVSQFDTVIAEVSSNESNIRMKVSSNMPGLQIYTGNFLSEPFKPYQGICLEPQFLPNSPNRPDFPNSILLPGETYHHRIIYEFSEF